MESIIAPGAKKTIRSFTDPYAWQEGHKLVLMIYSATEKFPETERFGLISQLQRAVVSVTSNIAEGFRRKTRKDKQKFYGIALSSITEVQNQLLISRDIRYLEKEMFKSIAEQSVRVSKLTNGLIKGAQDRK